MNNLGHFMSLVGKCVMWSIIGGIRLGLLYLIYLFIAATIDNWHLLGFPLGAFAFICFIKFAGENMYKDDPPEKVMKSEYDAFWENPENSR